MYLNLCLEAPSTDDEKQTEEKNGKGIEGLWKEKREDEGAVYWGIGVYCE